ncbi:MAG: 50S ribosomal protein L22 [Candidatus Pacebacteria bacterium]|nr:50S ribosomal protein L22 [Candidatus Paceibacterota bacterium]
MTTATEKKNTARAKLSTYRQSPRKVRLVVDAIRGKKVSNALEILRFVDKRAAGPILTLLNSAISNAKDRGIKEENLYISKITVDEGPILYRRRARARGAAFSIRKRTSHIDLELSEK